MHRYTSLAICTLSVNWALTLLAFLAVIAICMHKWTIIGRLGVDDGLIFSSFVVGVVLVGVQTWAIVDEGQGNHQQDISGSQLARAAKSLLVGEALWSLVNGLLRVVAGLLIYKTFGVQRIARMTGVAVIAISPAVALVFIVQVFLICRPFAAQWDPSILGTCGDQITSFIILESTGLVLDIAILAVPAVVIAKLSMTRRRKVEIILVLDMGAIILVVTGLRMGALRDAISPDFSYSQSYLSLLSAAGSMAGIICCASPALRALVIRVVGRRALGVIRHRTELRVSGNQKQQATRDDPITPPPVHITGPCVWGRGTRIIDFLQNPRRPDTVFEQGQTQT